MMAQVSGIIYSGLSLPSRVRIRGDDRLSTLLEEVAKPLFTVRTVFPFVLFPDQIIIRPYHVDIITGLFFGSYATTRVQIADIRQMSVMYNPFFATLEIIPQGPLEQIVAVPFLRKKQAMRARRIIAGLIESHQQNVDLRRYGRRKLLEAMEALGRARE